MRCPTCLLPMDSTCTHCANDASARANIELRRRLMAEARERVLRYANQLAAGGSSAEARWIESDLATLEADAKQVGRDEAYLWRRADDIAMRRARLAAEEGACSAA